MPRKPAIQKPWAIIHSGHGYYDPSTLQVHRISSEHDRGSLKRRITYVREGYAGGVTCDAGRVIGRFDTQEEARAAVAPAIAAFERLDAPVQEARDRLATLERHRRRVVAAVLGQTSPVLELGQTYLTQDGAPVRVINVTEVPGYETVQGDDREENELGHRYNRPGPDMGRATGSPHDWSDPRNLVHPDVVRS